MSSWQPAKWKPIVADWVLFSEENDVRLALHVEQDQSFGWRIVHATRKNVADFPRHQKDYEPIPKCYGFEDCPISLPIDEQLFAKIERGITCIPSNLVEEYPRSARIRLRCKREPRDAWIDIRLTSGDSDTDTTFFRHIGFSDSESRDGFLLADQKFWERENCR